MASNKSVVESYFASKGTGYSELLADDVELIEWVEGGGHLGVRTQGKAAFVANRGTRDYETRISRLTEEGNVVVAEGTARGAKKEGGHWRVQFVDLFEVEGGKLRRLHAYGVSVKDAD
jgi:uncharacterized protein